MINDLLAQSNSLTKASDGLALTMLFLIAFSLGMILTILLVMARNAGKKPELHIEKEEENPPLAKTGNSEQPQDWEREADWWKE